MTEVARWEHPREAAGEAVVWSLIASVAEENKKTVRGWLVDYLTSENSRGVDAVAAGRVIGSVTRSKPREVTDVRDEAAFMAYVVEHHPDLLTVPYQARNALLNTLKEVEGQWVDREGRVVPGVHRKMTSGSVKVLPDGNARDLVRGLLRHGRIELDGIREETPRLDAEVVEP